MGGPFALFLFFCSAALLPLSRSISVSVSPSTLSKSGETVRIEWSGIENPSDLDWLGIYSPPDSAHQNFIGYLFLSSAAGWETGSGKIELPLVNLRSNYAFRIFRWTRDEIDQNRHDHDNNPLPGTKHLLTSSKEVGFLSPAAPEQVHLSFTDKEDEMRVMFVTGDGAETFVEYGEDENMDQISKSDVMKYHLSDMCDSPANSSRGWRDPGFIHDAVMKNLKPRTRYFYRIGSKTKGWTSTYNFTSRDETSNETIAFLFGDMGTYAPYSTFRRLQEESKSTIKWILRDLQSIPNGHSPFISHIGDISYARGYSWIWDEFFNQIEPLASSIPYHVCIGNHEYDWPTQPWRPSWSTSSYGKDGGGECGVPYSLKFNMPGNSSLPTGTSSPSTRNLYFSFNSGPVHFLYISTETDFLPGSEQYGFIKKDLENVDRKRTPFVVVQGHRPMYTTSNEVRDAPLREKFLESLEPLLVGNNVTLALWGHVHRYERFCPLRNFSCVDPAKVNGTVHLVIGMAGQDWQPIWEPRVEHPDVPIFPQPGRSMYRGGEFGYTRLRATRERLVLEYVGNHDGEVHDTLEILSGYDDDNDDRRMMVREDSFFWYVKGFGVLMLGCIIGYLLGYVSGKKREEVGGNKWTPVKSDEV